MIKRQTSEIWNDRIRRAPDSVLVVLALVMVLLIGFVDYITGFEISFSVFYMMPVAFLTWYVNRWTAVALAFISAVEWFLADSLFGHTFTTQWIALWNAAVRLVFFISVVFLLDSLKQALLRERHLSRYDYLTKIHNTRAFYDILDTEIQRSQRYGHPLTVVYIDCDHFKEINDRYGHKEGDRLLQKLAAVMRQNLRNTDTLARLGGDEFAILLPQIKQRAAERVLKKLTEMVTTVMRNNNWPVTLSVGAVTYTRPPDDLAEALKAADAAMYQAKHSGRNTIHHKSVQNESNNKSED